MTTAPARVRRTYYVLGFGNTFAASLIWGVNTIFLLDAGLTNLEAFAANAFFTAGMVLYEGGLDTVFARGQVVSGAGMLLGAGGGGYALVAAAMPVRQAYLNGMIPSRQRATILSFDSLMSSAGGVVAQPALGRAADAWGYPMSYVASAALSACAVPLVWLSRRERPAADTAVEPAATPT